MNQFKDTIDLFEHSNFYYIIITGLNARYTYINNHYDKSFSHIHDTIIDKPYQITMHKDDALVCEEVGAKCFASPDKMFPATIRKHDGMGGYVYTQWECKAIFNDDNEPQGIFCFGYDITKFIDEQQQLKIAESEIEEKTHILKDIAFQHAHLIRSPLSNVMGLAQILDKMEIDTNVKNICTMILQSANQLDDIIRNVVEKSYK